MTTFDNFWTRLRSTLYVGLVIDKWSSQSGYAVKQSRIEKIDEDLITVSGQESADPRCIPKHEFRRVSELWEGYNEGTVSRSDLVDLSFNTTYIINILHWLEGTNETSTPDA